MVAALTVARVRRDHRALHRPGAQTPRLSNGRIESHATTNIAPRCVPALAATFAEHDVESATRSR
jgi:hypothetical protein